MATPSTEFYRLDPLTGSHNFLSFVETLDRMSSMEERPQFSILYTGLNYMTILNESKGHVYGDSALRWLGIVLQEECNSPTYRIGGDEFAVILTAKVQSEYEDLVHRLFERLNIEGEQLGIPAPAARIALIHYDEGEQITFYDAMFQLGETVLDLITKRGRTVNIFWARELIKSTATADDQNLENINHSWNVLRAIAKQAINRVLNMGHALDATQKNSFLDSISGLPNMRAALLKLENEISSKQLFAVLLIDGDNIRRYNSISYAAGDELIQKMGGILSENLRPGDFIARWRTGDEFIVILPNTSGEGARIVGERFCSAIREASKAWKFPTSISIGISTYPKYGDNVNALVDVAEAANKRAKDEGKDRVVLAE